MRCVVRTVLVWLMALAIPVQGLAAAGMRHCGVGPGPVTVAVSGAAMQTHAYAHSHSHADDGPAHDAHHAHHAHADAPDAGHACSACAACCVSLGLPAPALRLPAPPPEAGISSLPMTRLYSFVPSGLERPPRTLRA